MGYVYAAMYRAKEAIKKALRFYFNPKFSYSIEGDIPNNIHSGVLDCIERLIPDTKIQDKIIIEIYLYKNAARDFGRKMATITRDTLLPVFSVKTATQSGVKFLLRKYTTRGVKLLKTETNRSESYGQDSVDPISFDADGVLEDWVRGKDMFLEDRGVSNWMALDPPSANAMLLGLTSDDDKDLGAGFDDHEIFVLDKEDNAQDTM